MSVVTDLLQHVAEGVGAIGLLVIVYGVIVGTVELVRLELTRGRKKDICRQLNTIRQDLGYYILLGLEFLIAADIIHTVPRPTMQELYVLGAIVGVRTVISYFLDREMRTFDRYSTGEEDDV